MLNPLMVATSNCHHQWFQGHMKKTVRFLLGGMIVSLGLSSLLAQAQQKPPKPQVSDAQIRAMVNALKDAAPPNSANDGLYSEWQIKPGIIPDWSKRCIGRSVTPQELEGSPVTARGIVSCIAKRELNRNYAATNRNEMATVRRTACWWMTGDTGACQSGSTAKYVSRVVGFYEKEKSQTGESSSPEPTASPSPTPAPTPTEAPTPTPTPGGTPTPEPTPEPTPAPTPEPTPAPTPAPTPTPEPTATPTEAPTPTPSPTETPSPLPTPTPKPTPTPRTPR